MPINIVIWFFCENFQAAIHFVLACYAIAQALINVNNVEAEICARP